MPINPPASSHPRRVQQARTKGSRLPAGACSIVAPSRYGNPFRIIGTCVVGMNWPDLVEWDHGIGIMPAADVLYAESATHAGAVEQAVDLYRQLLQQRQQWWEPTRFAKWISDARGRDLSCYCPLTQPCHGDSLLEAANSPTLDLSDRRQCSGCGRTFSTSGLRAHQSGRFASAACKSAHGNSCAAGEITPRSARLDE